MAHNIRLLKLFQKILCNTSHSNPDGLRAEPFRRVSEPYHASIGDLAWEHVGLRNPADETLLTVGIFALFGPGIVGMSTEPVDEEYATSYESPCHSLQILWGQRDPLTLHLRAVGSMAL